MLAPRAMSQLVCATLFASFHYIDTCFSIANMNTYSRLDSAQHQGRVRKRRRFRVDEHFSLIKTPAGRELHVCKQDGCTKTFNKSTSSSHKREHYERHQHDDKSFKTISKTSRREHMVRFVASSGSPFSIVENRYLRFMTDTKYSRKTMSKRSRKMSAEQRGMLARKLRSINSISLTMDIWTSMTMRPFLCITGH